VPVLRSNWSVRASWRTRRALDALLARAELDALVFHTQVTSLFSRSLMQRIPSLVSLDATPINYDSVAGHYGHRAATNSFVDRQAYRLNRAALHAAERLVTWSEWARTSLIVDYAVDPGRIHVLAPGAAPAYFEIGDARSTTARDRRVKLLFVGGDFKRKGGSLLLEVMRGPLGERCELHLVTNAEVGSQPNVLVHRNVRANSPELLRLYAEADIFVLPTLADCLALVLMEATAAGLPVVTTNVGALGEAVQHGQSGLLLPADDSRALSDALVALVDDPQRRRRMAKLGHALAREKFDARRNNRVLLNLVTEMAHARHASTRAA
jgi:glycosyltransferase involved in cell wall biosynthesis